MVTNRRKTRIKFLERSEIDRLIASLTDLKEKALFQTLFSTGLRVKECVSLLRKDLEHPGIEDTKELSIIGKGGYQRVVFFSPVALREIRAYLKVRTDADPRLFPLTTRTAERIVKARAKAVGLVATPHTFRHSLATHLLRSGANIRVVQNILGHHSLSSTMVYTGCTNKDLLESHKKYLS